MLAENARDVIFHEHVFPFQTNKFFVSSQTIDPYWQSNMNPYANTSQPSPHPVISLNHVVLDPPIAHNDPPIPVPMRQSLRQKQTPAWMKDYYVTGAPVANALLV